VDDLTVARRIHDQATNGADLIDAYTDTRGQLPADALPALRAHVRPCVVRARCRLRRLQVC
jgi:hypothetical protein